MLRSKLAEHGFAMVPDIVGLSHVEQLKQTLEQAAFDRSRRKDDVFGARNILDIADIRALAWSPKILSLVQAVIGRDGRAVRGIFFDKTPGANWPVAWHQDLTLAVAERHEIPGWTNWSIKAGVHHVQPPADVLEQMLTLRVHLDDCDADNGPLRVLPGSHALGRIPAPRISELREATMEETCNGAAGSVLMMKPLLLHASSAAKKPAHRRVLHLEYAPGNLLRKPLRWLN